MASRRGIEIYNSLLNDNKRKVPGKAKGRDKDLIGERNECLLCRFYFYSKLHRIRFEDVLSLLKAEFFISEERIGILIQSLSKAPFEIYKEWEEKDFQKKYKFLSWKIIKD